MSRNRAMALLAAAALVLTSAACSDDGGADASVSDTGAPGTTAPEAPCPGTEVGSLPTEVEVPEDGPYGGDGPDPTPIGVAAGPDGTVFVNLAYSVYCIDDDTLFEVATPETTPLPDGAEESSYADIAVSADGNPLVADRQNPRVFEIEDETATIVPGSDDPAIGGSRSIEAGPDGTIYVTGLDQSGSTGVYAIADGEARPYAGGGELGVAGDGGPATASYLAEPEGLHLDPDGNLYIADRNNARIAVVAPDGTIDTLVGGEFFDDRPDSDALGGPEDVAIDPAGVVHVIDGDGDPSGLWRVEDDGTTTPLSGDVSDCTLFLSASEPERCAIDQVDLGGVFRLAFDADGTLWMTQDAELLRAVDGEVEVAVEFTLA